MFRLGDFPVRTDGETPDATNVNHAATSTGGTTERKLPPHKAYGGDDGWVVGI
jgi:hypothetical protein